MESPHWSCVDIYQRKKSGLQIISSRKIFYGPSGKPYTIGNAGHEDAYQFNGSVVLLSVLNWASSIDDVEELRGLRFITL